eukprot:scaffold72525_cov53-Phaeocystis_antarctica.AAC.1
MGQRGRDAAAGRARYRGAIDGYDIECITRYTRLAHALYTVPRCWVSAGCARSSAPPRRRTGSASQRPTCSSAPTARSSTRGTCTGSRRCSMAAGARSP